MPPPRHERAAEHKVNQARQKGLAANPNDRSTPEWIADPGRRACPTCHRRSTWAAPRIPRGGRRVRSTKRPPHCLPPGDRAPRSARRLLPLRSDRMRLNLWPDREKTRVRSVLLSRPAIEWPPAPEAGEARHLSRVCRLGVGDVVEVFDGRGWATRSEVIAIGDDWVELSAVGAALPGPLPPSGSRLRQQFPKGIGSTGWSRKRPSSGWSG